MKNIALSIVFLLAFGWNVQAQTYNAYVKAADNAFMKKDYYSSLIYYTNALEFDTNKLDILYNVAESARLFKSYDLAESSYQQLIELDENSDYPLAQYWLAEMKQTLGKYDEAKTEYELYLSQNNEESLYHTQKALKEILACQWAFELEDNAGQRVTIAKMEGDVNTPYSEFGGLDHDNSFLYSSLRFEETESKQYPAKLYSKVLKSNEGVSDIFIDKYEDGQYIAHSTFNKDNSMLYFTKCHYVNSLDIQCQIYRAPIDINGELGVEEKLNTTINSEGYTSTQPHVTYLRDIDKDVLYFVSDREGGEGKLDIWESIIETDGTLSIPMNVSAVNTVEDDITPFYHAKTAQLYFSSEGFLRLGGFDIYKSRRIEDGYADPVHLGSPLNTSFDDVYFSLAEEGEFATLSSNRIGSYFIDSINQSCCYDIYKADIVPIRLLLDVQTFNKFNLAGLVGANVRIYDTYDNSQVAELTNLEAFNHLFELEAGIKYMIVAEKMPFKNDTLYFDTNGFTESQELVKKLFLGYEYLSLDVFTFDIASRLDLNGAIVQLIDLTDNSVQDIRIDNFNGNEFHFRIYPGRTYKIIATKNGYRSESKIIDTGLVIESEKITENLYLRKNDLNIFLPLALFFDNDRPNPKTYSNLTRKTYTQTYFPFLERRNTYIRRTKRNKSEGNRAISAQQMKDFFEYDVKAGYEKLNLFLTSLVNKLEAGNRFELTVRGHTSPLAVSNYNLALGQRRVITVRNEMKKYMGGILRTYIENGYLKITDISLGEVQAPLGISDRDDDSTRSIYSIEASKERRVEIIKISSIEN